MGTIEPFELQVARGQITMHSSVIIFGYNADVDTSEESVWPDGGTIPHPTVASVLKISSSSANDTAAGTGARTVAIFGVDADYNEVSESVVLDGQNSVNTGNSYLYINGFYVTTAGSGGANAGNINAGTGTVTSGVPAVLYDIIATGYNNRTTAHYCVPAGYTGYMVQGLFSSGQASGTTAVTGFLKQHGPDGILRVGAVATVNNSAADYVFEVPYVIPEKNCVGATAIGSAANNAVSAYFNIILIKNTGV
jgi:uncharacterized Zn-binding protein involved in type VI secretion